MRILILAAGAAVTLAACGGGGSEAENNAATLQVDNLVVNGTVADDAAMNMGIDGNMASDANMTTAGNTQEMMNQDATTNDPDTNLANGI